jgi:two-component system response regulator CpxR
MLQESVRSNPGEVPARILIVDDDQRLCRLLRDYLTPLGYIVDKAHSAPDGLRLARKTIYDAIILDVMLGTGNGLDVLRELRQNSQVPVLMLTALGEEPDRVGGLELGADDYLTKTVSHRELLARLRAVLRRSRVSAKTQEEQAISIGDLLIDPNSRTAILRGNALNLTRVEYEILMVLARSAGRIKTREALSIEVNDRVFAVFDRSIDVHVSSLRRKLGDDPKNPRFIVTVHGVGYLMRRAEERLK